MTEDTSNNNLLVLVDDEDRQTGTMEKLRTHELGLLHRAFSVIIYDHAGRILLHRRAASKYHSGQLWTNACCGHPAPGADIKKSAQQRLQEEMGFTCDLHWNGVFKYWAEVDAGLAEHEIVHIFHGVYEGPINPDPNEADAVAWATPSELAARVRREPEVFTAWFRAYVLAEWPIKRLERLAG